MVIETAVNGGADVIATFNIDDMRAGAARFGIAAEDRQRFYGDYDHDHIPASPARGAEGAS